MCLKLSIISLILLIIAFNEVDASKKNKYLTTRYNEVNVRNGQDLIILLFLKYLRKDIHYL